MKISTHNIGAYTTKTKQMIYWLMFIMLTSLISCDDAGNNPDDKTDDFESNSIVKVDSTLQSKMVLQQNAEFSITGQGTPNEKIRIQCSWEDSTTFHIVDVSTEGTWSAEVQIPSASYTSYSVTVEGKTKKVFDNILIGEVWLCSGQSNMYLPMKECDNANLEINQANYPEIRIMNMTRKTADNPTNTITSSWEICTPSNIMYFSAVAYFFGRELHQVLNIPIGLIGANWGNTSAQVWTNRELIMKNSILAEIALITDNEEHTDGSPNVAGSAYNSMIYPLRRIPIAGAIWYQGENNQGYAYTYPLLLSTMVEGWRNDWEKEFPFYIAQICPFKRIWDYKTNYSNSAMRYMQAVASEKINNSGVEVNDDIGDIDNVHPTNKKDVGLRLAYLSLSDTYQKDAYSEKKCPIYDYFEIDGNKITIHFKYASQGLKTSDSETPSFFEIAGTDSVFYPANATISENTIILSNDNITNPIAARLGWSYVNVTNLRSSNGLPVSVFRTYDWEDKMEEQ